MWLFVNNQPCFGYIQITTLNNKNTFGAPKCGAQSEFTMCIGKFIKFLYC